MSPIAISLIAFACIFFGTVLGMFLRTLLPEHHMSADSKSVMTMGVGMIATLAALILGLMVSSAKGSFDTLTGGLRRTSANIIMLDRAMADYGPETKDARDLLRLTVMGAIERLWPEEKKTIAVEKLDQTGSGMRKLEQKILQLSPRNEEQRRLQSNAVQIIEETAAANSVLFESVGQSSLPRPFIVMLICWLTIIFFSFGLYAGRGNATVIAVLFVCALSVSSSLFVILDMDQPYGGVIKISSAPLKHALAHIGQ